MKERDNVIEPPLALGFMTGSSREILRSRSLLFQYGLAQMFLQCLFLLSNRLEIYRTIGVVCGLACLCEAPSLSLCESNLRSHLAAGRLRTRSTV